MSAPALGAVFALDLVALVQTATFAPLLALGIGAVALGVWRGRAALTLGAVGLAVAATLLLFGPALGERLDDQYTRSAASATNPLIPQTLEYRWDHWTQDYFPALEGHWLAGYGPELPESAGFPWAESMYLELLTRGGLVLLLVFAALMVAWGAAALRRAHDRDPAIRAVARMTVVVLVLLAFVHVIEPYFVDSGPPHVLWALAGIAFAAGAVRGQEPDRSGG